MRQFSGMTALPFTAPIEGMMTVQQEEVGLPSQRLERIRAHCQCYSAAAKVAGSLTLVACQG